MSAPAPDDGADLNMNLHQRWQATWQQQGLPLPPDSLFDELLAHYQEPHRHYHTLQHLEECFTKLGELRDSVVYAGAVEFALWFHDAIYDVRRQDNEEKSAAWAGNCLCAAGVPEATVEQVRSLIMATRHHQSSDDPDADVLLDADLSILGAEPKRFAEYEQQIRLEYCHVPELVFVQRRKQVLEDFMRRPRIFRTRRFFERYEQAARRNLAYSLKI